MIPLRDDNPPRTTPVVTIAIIALCVIAFLWQWQLPPEDAQRSLYQLGFIPGLLLGKASFQDPILPPAATIATAMFLHGSLLHLAANMLYLWIFGDTIEDRIGRGQFALFYLMCGVVAALAQALPDPSSTVPMVGASGAISGVLGAYVALYRRANVLVALPSFVESYTFRVPAVALIGVWFLGQLASAVAAEEGAGGVAFIADVGGFLAGVLLIRLFARDRRVTRVR